MEDKKPGFIQSLLTSTVVMVIVVAAIIGLPVIKLPIWPFVIFLFGLTSLASQTKEGWIEALIGGLIGIFVGASNMIVAHFVNEAIGTVVLLVLTVVSALHEVSFELLFPAIITYLITAALFGVVIFISGSKKQDCASKTV